MNARTGAALLELLTATTLLGILGVVSAVLLRSDALILRDTSDHVTADEALRTASGVIRSELRNLTSSDVHAVSADSVSARVVRGWGIVCAMAGQQVGLRYHGVRDPDPDKDSLLIAGEERTGSFRTGTGQAPHCLLKPDEELYAMTPGIAVHPGSVVLFFETGAYHIAANALRYRRANEGRQPLTDEVLDHRASFFRLEEGGRGLVFSVRADPGRVRAPYARDARFRFLNR